MKRSLTVIVGVVFVLGVIASPITHAETATGGSQLSHSELGECQESTTAQTNLITIDRCIQHVSTVPANAGEPVKLFLREKVLTGGSGGSPVVLMIGGATTPAVEVFDLPFRNYSWMEFLAESGFDVFAMDFTGYGLSPRPKMSNPCNVLSADQKFLKPADVYPLTVPCAGDYQSTLTSIKSDWDEMDTIVSSIFALREQEDRRIEKINLLGWSRAGLRIGGYLLRHQVENRVEKLFLYDPRYNRSDPADPPQALPETPGAPMRIQPVSDFSGWDAEVHTADQFAPGIRDVMTTIRREYDPLGRTWGVAGVRRFPVQGTLFGWNQSVTPQIKVPTLVIAGEFDRQTGVGQARDLYSDLTGVVNNNKVFIHVAGASHQMVWENQHMVLLKASRDWLLNSTFDGYRTGIFAVDAAGKVQIESLLP